MKQVDMSVPNQYYYDDGEAAMKGSKLPATALTARVVTMVSLIVSIAVLKTNDTTLSNGYVMTYTYFTSYKYMFYVTVIGSVYTMLQIPFAVYYMIRKKHLINSEGFLMFDFYADKAVAFLLATGVGVALGATVELKKVKWEISDPKVQDFLTMQYIPEAFLVVGCLASVISSVQSSLAVITRTTA